MADEVPVATAEGGDDAGGTAYAVTVEAFSGPLDLLLYLVRRTELDITEIPIAEIADQFVETVRGWHERGELDLEMAGDFVLMAATLLEIKARTIAPPPEEEGAGDDDDDDLVDPRADLIAKLLAYRRFKEATAHLQRLQAERWERAVRRFKEEIPEDPEEVEGLDLGELDPHALWKCWNVIVTRLGGMGPRTVAKDDIPIEARVGSVIEFGREQRRTTLRQLLARESSHLGRVTTLMATLEVVRQRWLEARQWEQFGDVDLRFREQEEREAKPVLPEPEPDDGKKRRRRPPLATWTPPPTATPVEGEAPGEGEDGEVENFESDEERFLRELNEACALDRVLRDAKDWEGGFRRHWEVLHPPPPPPPQPDPPPAPPVPEPAPAAAEPAAETPAKPKRVPPWLRKKAETPAEPAAPQPAAPVVVELPVVARAALQRIAPQAETLVEPPAPAAPAADELPVVARALLEPVPMPAAEAVVPTPEAEVLPVVSRAVLEVQPAPAVEVAAAAVPVPVGEQETEVQTALEPQEKPAEATDSPVVSTTDAVVSALAPEAPVPPVLQPVVAEPQAAAGPEPVAQATPAAPAVDAEIVGDDVLPPASEPVEPVATVTESAPQSEPEPAAAEPEVVAEVLPDPVSVVQPAPEPGPAEPAAEVVAAPAPESVAPPVVEPAAAVPEPVTELAPAVPAEPEPAPVAVPDATGGDVVMPAAVEPVEPVAVVVDAGPDVRPEPVAAPVAHDVAVAEVGSLPTAPAPVFPAEPDADQGESWDDDSGEPSAPAAEAAPAEAPVVLAPVVPPPPAPAAEAVPAEAPVVQAPVVPPPQAAAPAPAPHPVSGNARPSPWPLVFAAGLTAAMIGAWLVLRPARPVPQPWPAPLPPLAGPVLVVDAPAVPDAQPAAFPPLPTVSELATLGLPAWFDAPAPVVVPWDAFLPPAPAAPGLPQLGQGRSLDRVQVSELGRPGGWTLALTVAPVVAPAVPVVPWDAFLPPPPEPPALWWLGRGPGLADAAVAELGRPGGWTRALVAGPAQVAVVPWDAWLPVVPATAPGLDAWRWPGDADLLHWARPDAWKAGQAR
jgi:segregation and condensation protein A